MSAPNPHSPDEAGVRVRHATVQDASEIARLITQLGYPATADEMRERWQAWKDQGNQALVVGIEAAELLGVCTLHCTSVLHRPKPVGRLTALVVDERARGRGVGRAIVAAAEVELKRSGCGMVEITSSSKRAEAHAFYESLGYEKTSVRMFKSL